ncbi:hypothetical protein GCM10022393_19800 [Aquimarina addita]|uniref:N-acetylmuramoyl-L-alanine amidase n=2 Tax=Aquimarina addita TaxID=870485 RepID=A0ABP6UHS5_9FLAO
MVVIDPGHGGKDTGAIGVNNIREKDVVLNVAMEILRLNKTILNDEFDIYLTRYKDTLISLSDRTRLAKHLNANVFVSLHCNASQNYSKGIEVYVYNSDNLNTRKAIAIGASVLNESTQKLGFKERGVKFANFQVLRENTSFIPSVLVEMGFITYADEADYFLKPKNIRALALAVLMGL